MKKTSIIKHSFTDMLPFIGHLSKDCRMFSSLLEESKRALTLYHLLNSALSISFLLAKNIPQICELLFSYVGECGVDSVSLFANQ